MSLRECQISWPVFRLLIALIFTTAYLCLGAVVFWLVEGESQTFSNSPTAVEGKEWGGYLNAIYFCGTTITTIGYGDLVPTTTEARILVMVYVTIGFGFIGITVASLTSVFVELTEGCIAKFNSIIYADEKFEEDRPHRQELPLYKRFLFKCHSVIQRNIKLLACIVIFCILEVCGAAIFMTIEDWTYFESFYFCFITLTTIGYGDFTPQSTAGRCIVIPFAFIGLGVSSLMLTQAAQLFGKKARRISSGVNKYLGIGLGEKDGVIAVQFCDKFRAEKNDVSRILIQQMLTRVTNPCDADELISFFHDCIHDVEKKKDLVLIP